MTDKKITVSVSSGGGSPPLKDGGGFPFVPTVLTWSLDQDPSNFNPSEQGATKVTEDDIKALCYSAEIATLKQRIEALEAALSRIYAWYPISVTQPHQTINDMREFARAALAGEKKDE